MPQNAETRKKIQIITGATCDLPDDWLHTNNILNSHFILTLEAIQRIQEELTIQI